MWLPGVAAGDKDYHVAFRGEFELHSDQPVCLKVFGASWFVGWLDGEYLCEGPARFTAACPEYQSYTRTLKKGKHTIAFQVTHTGEVTRMLKDVAPLVYCVVESQSSEIPVAWKCMLLDGYSSQLARVNKQLGWVEWCDTRRIPVWQSPDFDDSAWVTPERVDRTLGPLRPLSTRNTQSITQVVTPSDAGNLVEMFGYEKDNPAAQFFLRELNPQSVATPLPPQGVWRRYDLGRVRLMRPRFEIDLPPGAVVEFAYSESLYHGRVSPWIALSSSDSCNLDHFVARGGPQEFFPLAPKGGRFMEVHVLAPPERVNFIREEIVERIYFGEPEGSFNSDDELLNQVWSTGVATLRACSEDALTDNPTRERGQWTGDVVSVGLDLTAVGYSDLSLLRRALTQSAACADEQGMVAAVCPGTTYYIPTFAAQWTVACVHYWELTGDRKILEELLPAAKRNVAAFKANCTADGLVFAPRDALIGAFVDWGYVPSPGVSDMGTNLQYLACLRAMVRWCNALNDDDTSYYEGLARHMETIVRRYFEQELSGSTDAWQRIGYHRAAFGLKLGLFDEQEERDCVEYLKQHMLSCFPNNATAPRLSNPEVGDTQLVTPYFAHFVLPELICRGEFEFVLDQYRKCWGWSLGDGRTTWLEVFDPRWSHCHQWAGSPTWQLSRYVLGVTPRFDLGERHYEYSLVPCSLQRASGTVPLPDGSGVLQIEWETREGKRSYRLKTPVPITLHLPPSATSIAPRVVKIDDIWEHDFPVEE
ncbi:alpha-L-rhamnosidase-related protein [Aeoliella sp. SH292]|uniref:alpha-L-rhamnosidase-related protein n=1 Tax=Aeoliella sp. SH292 TaxID=3454464 RepID=UPI003F979E4C